MKRAFTYAFTSVILSAKFMSCFSPSGGSTPGMRCETSVPQVQWLVWVIGARDGEQFCRPQQSWDAWRPLINSIFVVITHILPLSAHVCHPLLIAARGGPPTLPLATPLPRSPHLCLPSPNFCLLGTPLWDACDPWFCAVVVFRRQQY